MSVRVMSLVWDSTVPTPERFTLLALADRADEDGVCWPSIPTLARKCQVGESTIRRHLAVLDESGVLAKQQRFNASSVYTIDVGRLRSLAQPDRTPSQTGTPSQSGRGSRSGTPSQIGTTPPPRLSGPPSQSERLSIIDPSVDPSEHPLAPKHEDRFAEFYAAYPRRKDRRSAEKAWRAAVKRGADPDTVIEAARRYAEQTRTTEARYVKYPASWLNAGAYDDDPDTARPQLRAVAGGYQPYRNPVDQSVYEEPMYPQEAP